MNSSDLIVYSYCLFFIFFERCISKFLSCDASLLNMSPLQYESQLLPRQLIYDLRRLFVVTYFELISRVLDAS